MVVFSLTLKRSLAKTIKQLRVFCFARAERLKGKERLRRCPKNLTLMF